MWSGLLAARARRLHDRGCVRACGPQVLLPARQWWSGVVLVPSIAVVAVICISTLLCSVLSERHCTSVRNAMALRLGRRRGGGLLLLPPIVLVVVHACCRGW